MIFSQDDFSHEGQKEASNPLTLKRRKIFQ